MTISHKLFVSLRPQGRIAPCFSDSLCCYKTDSWATGPRSFHRVLRFIRRSPMLTKPNMLRRPIWTGRCDFGKLDCWQNSPFRIKGLPKEWIVALWLSRQNRKPLRYISSKALPRSNRRRWSPRVDSCCPSSPPRNAQHRCEVELSHVHRQPDRQGPSGFKLWWRTNIPN